MTAAAVPAEGSARRVAVTGAARGIGLAISAAFARHGDSVLMLDRDGVALHEACAGLRAQGLQARAQAVDVTDAQALAQLAAAQPDSDVLVCNAGILLRGPVTGADMLAQWRQTLDVNLNGCFYTAHAFLPGLLRRRGCIVNVASIHATVAVLNSAAYTASKGGVKQLTQALALELGPQGVRVNAVAPGLTETDMTQALCADADALERFLERVPLRRTVQPADVAAAVLFLASSQAACITGVLLPVDGGYCAN